MRTQCSAIHEDNVLRQQAEKHTRMRRWRVLRLLHERAKPAPIHIDRNLRSAFLDEALEIATRVTHTSAPITKLDKPRNNFGGVATQLFYQPVTLFDLSASYKISENATAGFSIENVFDRYYIDPLSLSMMPGPDGHSKPPSP